MKGGAIARIALLTLAVTFFVGGCRKGSEEGRGVAMPVIESSEGISSSAGKQVTIRGTAREAKGGSVVLVDGNPVYLPEIEGWPDGVDGKVVVVKGELQVEKFIPSPTVDADGAISQGAHGKQTVLRKAEWKLAPVAGK